MADGITPPPVQNAHPLRWQTVTATTDSAPLDRSIATEIPVALQYNCISHAVMMASPDDLEDFALGFSLSEGIIHDLSDCLDLKIQSGPDGIVIEMEITPDRFATLEDYKRHLIGQSGCGLCGKDSLEQVITPLPVITSPLKVSGRAIHSALETLSGHQPYTAQTGAFHVAAFANDKGDILAAREDVGRHNALDKLIGHMARNRFDPAQGFILMSSRCSFELVHKTARAGVPLLATISAPTSLAIELANQAQLTLVALARSDSMLLFSDKAARFIA